MHSGSSLSIPDPDSFGEKNNSILNSPVIVFYPTDAVFWKILSAKPHLISKSYFCFCS